MELIEGLTLRHYLSMRGELLSPRAPSAARAGRSCRAWRRATPGRWRRMTPPGTRTPLRPQRLRGEAPSEEVSGLSRCAPSPAPWRSRTRAATRAPSCCPTTWAAAVAARPESRGRHGPPGAQPPRARGPAQGRDAAAVRGAGLHPPARPGAPRPQAQQHHGGRGPPGAADGLRARRSRGRRAGDGGWAPGGHLPVHGARGHPG